MSSVLCIGGAAVDRFCQTEADFARLRTSNIGTATRHYGGAARNVAEALARLGAKVSLLTKFGNDADGGALYHATAAAGVDVSLCLVDDVRRTASYTAILHGNGELVIGVADMAILDSITADEAVGAIRAADPGVFVYADANLPAETLAAVIAERPGTLAVCPVSEQKGLRLHGLLSGIDYLFCNRYEAPIVAGSFPGLPLNHKLRDLAQRFIGLEQIPAGIITGGSDGAILWRGKAALRLPPQPAKPVNVNGAGDVLAAATIARLLAGDDFVRAAQIGMAAAAITVEAQTSVPADLSMGAVLARHQQMHLAPS